MDVGGANIVLSASGEPAYIQIPFDTFSLLSENEQETLEILLDNWWTKELPKRLHNYNQNKASVLKDAVPLDEYMKTRGKE